MHHLALEHSGLTLAPHLPIESSGRLLVGSRAFVRLAVCQGFTTLHLAKAGLPLSSFHQAIRLRRGVKVSFER
jgi:hypothetical protein